MDENFDALWEIPINRSASELLIQNDDAFRTFQLHFSFPDTPHKSLLPREAFVPNCYYSFPSALTPNKVENSKFSEKKLFSGSGTRTQDLSV